MKVAVIQMVSGRKIEANLYAASELLKQAAAGGAELVLLPENFYRMGGKRGWLALGQQNASPDGYLREFLSLQASSLGLWVVGGTLPTTEVDIQERAPLPDRVFTSCFVYSPEGAEVSRYDKMHLFDVDVDDGTGRYRESDTYSAGGDQPVIASLPDVTLGLSICYDLRFPELYRALSELGANVLVVPSAFTYATGQAHWEVLLRARAIENQCYILAANQGGAHSSRRRTWGHSCIVDPWGEILAQIDAGPGVIFADLDMSHLETLRQEMPVLAHRRL
jgi:nitrilase